MANGTRVRHGNGRQRQYAFYIIEPRENFNADRFAKRLMAFKRVREVYVTEGDCGFIVKAAAKESGRGPIPANALGATCRRVGLAISRYAYRK